MKNHKHTFSRNLLAELLAPNANIIEAGAHLGRDTIKLSQLFQQGHVFAFEPNPYVFERLIENTKHLPNVTCFNLALSNVQTTAQLYVSPEISALSSLHRPTKDLYKKNTDLYFQSVSVQTNTLDNLYFANNIPLINFMWLDLQGHELASLQGAQYLLKTTSLLLIEVNLIKRYAHQPLYQEVKAFLYKHNFHVRLEHFHHNSWGNVLFEKIHE